MLVSSYNQVLVLFSLAVAILASYTALDMAGRVATSTGRASRWWLAGGACAMGFGIWSMHFIGMLAFRLPIPLGYDLAITLYSVAISVVASAFALWLTSRPDLPRRRLVAGACLLGAGIAAMHYTGMAAMRMQPGIEWHLGWVAASVAVAVLASGAALWIAFRLRAEIRGRHLSRAGAAVVMGVAIVGMHYTGMAAASFPVGSFCGAALDGLHNDWLAILTIVVTVAILGIALIVSVLDRRLQQRTAVLSASLARAHDDLVHAALHDPLTRLPNRILLRDRTTRAIELAAATRRRVALMFVDLDGFKAVNDGYGHRVGDLLLCAVADRLRGLPRKSATLARLGGDEFVLVADVGDADEAARLATALVAAIERPFEVEGRPLIVSGSVGIALYPDDAADEELLMAHADAAMYAVKDQGRNGYRFFEPAMQASANEHIQLLDGLRRALDGDELCLHYQPKYGDSGAVVTGAEALLRWQHPELGELPPDRFIPIAERSGLILPLGDWVVDETCRQIRAWRDAGLGDWNVAINLSAVQFLAPDLSAKIADALERHGVAANRLTLEITESTAMQDTEATMATLQTLAAMGVHIAIDDFGTGYSSLLQLKRMPATELKIDRGFIRDLEANGEDAAIVASIIALGRALNLTVVAEGVETHGQREHLRNLGCLDLQGFLLGRPVPADAFAQLLGGLTPRMA
ncbi:putative bifunctional diguanylate cyclase/phosphodiesterase [Luteimonas abyssi]|uniref:putative bifunctional diguanylate cyclase/phosphodiesterase n=1 Tax=Luteimonas abyssi TaxID=1247514 RepID=UPI000737D046|nr:bifunctional diguanylate cyclase/phosphodiesterase [Luteimonas abyssi]